MTDESGVAEAGSDGPSASLGCPTEALFCDSFDDGRSDVLGTWARLEGSTSAFSLSPTGALSAPAALEIEGRGGQAYLARQFTTSSIRVDLDYRLDADPAATGEVDLLTIKFEPRPSDVTNQLVALAARSGSAAFEWYYVDGNGAALQTKPLTVSLRKWIHVRLTLEPIDGPATLATITIDANPSQSHVIPRPAMTSADLQIGYTLGGGTIMSTHLAYDNVVVTRPGR